MRTIKFRGKRLDGEWVYGGFHEHTKRQICPIGDELTNKDICSLIIQSGFADWDMPKPIIAFEVLPESVGQWTGLVDRHGKEIYEGDVCVCKKQGIMADAFEIFWMNEEGCWGWKESEESLDPFYQSIANYTEVISNKWDNPELMEVE